MGTRSRAGVHGSFCSPAAVSNYSGAVVAGSARTRSRRADPAISGVNSSPICFRYASSVWPLRAAYPEPPACPPLRTESSWASPP